MKFILDTNVVIHKKHIRDCITKNNKIVLPTLIKEAFDKKDAFITEMIYSEIYAQIWGPYLKYIKERENVNVAFLTDEELLQIKERTEEASKEFLDFLKSKIIKTSRNHFCEIVKEEPWLIGESIDSRKLKDIIIRMELEDIAELDADEVGFATNNTKDFKSLEASEYIDVYDELQFKFILKAPEIVTKWENNIIAKITDAFPEERDGLIANDDFGLIGHAQIEKIKGTKGDVSKIKMAITYNYQEDETSYTEEIFLTLNERGELLNEKAKEDYEESINDIIIRKRSKISKMKGSKHE